MINSSTSINSISQNLAKFSQLADKIADPNSAADAEDIVQFKAAGENAKISTAVLKRVLDTQRAVDILA